MRAHAPSLIWQRNFALRSLSPSSIAALEDAASNQSLRRAQRAVRLLASHGEHRRAYDALLKMAVRFPHSSAVLLQLAATGRRLGRDTTPEQVTALVDSDWVDASPSRILAAIFHIAQRSDLERLETRLASPGSTIDPSAERDARALLKVAILRTQGADARAIASAALGSRSSSLVVVGWAQAARRWDVIRALRDSIVETHDKRQVLPPGGRRLLREVAIALNTSGDISAARNAAMIALQVGRDLKTRQLFERCERDLAILNRPLGADRATPSGGWAKHPGGSIAYLLHNSLPVTTGGYAVRSHGLLTALRSCDWNMVGVTRAGYPLGTPDEDRLGRSALATSNVVDGVEYLRTRAARGRPGREGLVSELAQQIASLDRRRHWQLVHGASNSPLGAAAAKAASILGVPSIYEVRGFWEVTRASLDPGFGDTERYQLMARWETDACLAVDHVFAITNAARALLIERGVDSRKITVIPNGVDLARFKPIAPAVGLKAHLGLEGKVVIGYVGSVRRYEGLDLLLRALRHLVDQGLPVAFLLVGDGDGLDDVHQLVRELRLSDEVVLTGRVAHDDVDNYYSVIDIAPFPRLPLPVTEIISPLKPFEAMALGKPILVSNVAALAEIVTDGTTGLVVEKGSVASLADGLARLVEDPDLREFLAHNGREWVAENRSWPAIANLVTKTYEDLGLVAPAPIDHRGALRHR